MRLVAHFNFYSLLNVPYIRQVIILATNVYPDFVDYGGNVPEWVQYIAPYV